MSPFARGLLGGVAEGITDTASLLFQDAIAAKKEERLAKIADRNYLRDRRDTLSDIKAQRTYEDTVRADERTYEDTVRADDFSQRKELADLSLTQQKALIDYGLEAPQSPLGKLLKDRNQHEVGSPEYVYYEQQIQSSQIIENTNPYTGALSIAVPEYGPDGNLIRYRQVVTFDGFSNDDDDSVTPPVAPETPTEVNPAINSLSADQVQQAITDLEAALSSGNLRGASESQVKMRLRELEQRLQTLNAQSSRGFGRNPGNPLNEGLLAGR